MITEPGERGLGENPDRATPRAQVVSLKPWVRALISGFASVTDRQNHNLFPVVVIQGDAGPLPEFNHPLAELRRQLFDRPANLRVLAERFHTLPDRLDSALCGIPALGSQKLMETDDIQQGGLRPP
jgi:hypothetical protein